MKRRPPPRPTAGLGFLAAFLLAAVAAHPATAQKAAPRFPGATWQELGPAASGWSESGIGAATEQARRIGSAAVLVVHRGAVVVSWGNTVRPFKCHSMRKSILSALYGIHVARGRIELDKNLGQLGIDDKAPSLTPTEKRATVRQLLKARSGVYHPALYETAAMARRRPERGSHAPGTFWYYNNWDFNALGSIFENCTGRSLYGEFERCLARPLGMQDFVRDRHTRYFTGDDSVHPAYPFQLSARDLARFGLLFARGGRWGKTQVIPADWVAESTRSYSDAGGRGYGYMWWTSREGGFFPGRRWPDGCFAAAGAGGHYVLVVPQWDLVIVHRVNTFHRGERVSRAQFGKLASLLVAAMPAGGSRR